MLEILQEGLKLMIYGMGGIFIVTGIIYATMKLLSKIDQK